MTINVERGAKGTLKWLVEEEGLNEVRCYSDRQTIEKKLMNFNEKYYQKAYQTIAYKDKIY